MRNLGDPVVPTLPRTERSEATRTLHAACRTLLRMPPKRVGSLQITFQLDELPVPRASAEAFAQRIAMEYGVAARATAREKHITIFLTRTSVPEPHSKTNTPNEVPGWVSRFFSWLSF